MDNISCMKEQIEKLIRDMLKELSVPSPSIDIQENDLHWKISIQSQDDRPIVGRDGERFEDFSHLLKRMLIKIVGENAKVSVDVNKRQARNEEVLKTRAAVVAERARSFKTDIELEPMSSYERMIIHTFLEGKPNIKTESIGSGKERKLVVKYVENKEEDKEKF